MALYEYQCEKCGHRFEKRMPMSDVRQRVRCPRCSKNAKKLMASFAVTGRAEESFDFDTTPPDPRAMPDLGGGADGGHSHDHSHDHGHSHGFGTDDLGI